MKETDLVRPPFRELSEHCASRSLLDHCLSQHTDVASLSHSQIPLKNAHGRVDFFLAGQIDVTSVLLFNRQAILLSIRSLADAGLRHSAALASSQTIAFLAGSGELPSASGMTHPNQTVKKFRSEDLRLSSEVVSAVRAFRPCFVLALARS